MGLQEDWLTTTNFTKPRNPPPSNNSGGGGNFGNFTGAGNNGGDMNYPTLDSKLAREESADSFGVKDPQAIESYFKERSQFGVPANNNIPPVNQQNVPEVNINPNSVVSKSVLSIEASFEKGIEFEMDDLRLSGDNNKGGDNSGLDRYKIDPNNNNGQNTIQDPNDLFKDLENLKLDDSKEQIKDQQEEQRVKMEAQKSFINHQKSNLNPFQPPDENTSFQKPGQLSNLAFSNLNQNSGNTTNMGLGIGNYNDHNDKTIQDVNLPSFAKDNYGNQDPSLNLGGMKPTLDKAPEKLPLNRSYEPTQQWDKDAKLMESYGKNFIF